MNAPTLTDRLAEAETGTDELLEAHRGRSVEDFRRYHDDPVGFCRDVLRWEPWSKQREIADSVLLNKRTVTRGCHGAGKDAVLAALMLWAAYARGMLVLAISATERQLLNQLWRELRDRFSPQLPGELYQADLRINGERRIIAMTSGSVSNLTGFHDPHGVFVAISESQAEQVEASAFDAAAGNTIDDASRILVVGNPIKPAGRFFEVHSKPTWAKIRISAFDHPNCVEQRIVIPGGPAPGWPEEMAAEYGEGSPFYVARVLGDFPTEAEETLIKREWLEAAAERHDRWRQWLHEPEPTISVGVDVGRTGDRTVLAVRRGDVLTELLELPRADLMTTTGRLVLEFDRIAEGDTTVGREPFPNNGLWILRTPPAPRRVLVRPVVDVIGIGSGVVDRLRELGRTVEDFNASAPAVGPKAERYKNRRSQSYWLLREQLERGELRVARHAKLWEQLQATTWAPDSSGRVQLAAKDVIKRSLHGASPDHADALSMAIAGARPVATVGFSHVEL